MRARGYIGSGVKCVMGFSLPREGGGIMAYADAGQVATDRAWHRAMVVVITVQLYQWHCKVRNNLNNRRRWRDSRTGGCYNEP